MHQLVKSLSKSEKRYLKLLAEFGSGQSESAPVRLFDLLDGMESFDPEQLKASWPGPVRHLPALQTRLFDLILRGLRMLRSEEDLDWRLGKMLADIALLFERKLYRESLRRIVKGKKLCRKFGKYSFLLRFYQWEYKIHLLISRPGLQGEMNLAQQEKLETSRQLHVLHLAEVAEGMSRIRLRRDDRGKEDESHTELVKILSELDMLAPHPDTNFQAWSLWKRASGNAAYLEGNYLKACHLFGEILTALESRPAWLDQKPDDYLSVLNNFLNCCLMASEYEAFRQQIARIRDFPFESPRVRVQFEFMALIQELQFSINFLSYEQSLPILGQFTEWLSGHQAQVAIPKLLGVYFNAFAVHFVHGEYQKANSWLLKILDTPGRDERKDIREVARIFQVILHHELENPDLKDYLLASSYRYFHRNNLLEKMNLALVRFFRSEQKFPQGSKEYQIALKELDAATEDVIRTGSGKVPLGMTEVSFWAKSKLEGVGIRTIFERLVSEQRAGQEE